MSARWTWFVRAYYKPGIRPPKAPKGYRTGEREFAIEIGGISREALAMDLEILQAREDIGEIEGPFEVNR